MADPRKATILVHYKPGETPNYSFEPGPGIARGPGQELVFRNNGHPGFLLSFTLDAESFGDLVFPNDPQQALCSKVIVSDDDECPEGLGSWEGFKPLAVSKVNGENRILIVRNFNWKLPKGRTEERFGYTLYVTTNPNGNPDQFIAIDPIGSNQNGPRGFNLKRVVVGGILAAAVGALACVALS